MQYQEHSKLSPPLEAYELNTVRPTRADVDLSKISSNLGKIRQSVPKGTKVMGIVKSNAYGHGLAKVSQFLESLEIDSIGVGFLEEGIILRNQGINLPILVLGGVLGYQIKLFITNDLDITVSSLELAETLNDTAVGNGKRARVQMKIDTGMGRIGISPENAPALAEKIVRLPHLDLVGVYSHLATTDGSDDKYMYMQIEKFDNAIQKIKSSGIELEQTHIANSGAILKNAGLDYNTVRPGLLLYGLLPSENDNNEIGCRPALELKSRVIFIKEVNKGTSISYGRTYITGKRTRIATIPIGYGDGYYRQLSNKGVVIINGERFRIAGTVCMDQIMIDIGDSRDIRVGDNVTLIGGEGKEAVSAWEISKIAGTIPYEFLSSISARVPRNYYE